MALEALERRSRSRADRPDLAGRSPEGRRPLDPNRPKVGANWTPEEEQQLRDAFTAHKPIPEIATAHGRTTGAITARLVKLRLIEDTFANRPGLSRRNPSRAETDQGNRPGLSESAGPSRRLVAPEHPREDRSPEMPRRSEPPLEGTKTDPANDDPLPF